MEGPTKREDERDRQGIRKKRIAEWISLFIQRRSNAEKAIVLLLFILAFLWVVPELQVRYFAQSVPPEDVPPLINEYRRTWAQIVGGFGLFLGLYFTWRRVEISQQTLETQQDQQVTERFTRAIEQLGATDDKTEKPKLEIRLGGIYALERIAKDSPKHKVSPGRDYSMVMEVLTAYVRENARLPSKKLLEPPNKLEEKPPADIQAVLHVLGRREEDQVPEKYRVQLDLKKTNLRYAKLFEANLRYAKLFEADLFGADLRGADLTGATLLVADLRGATLTGATLTGADLTGAKLFGADLPGAKELTQGKLRQAIGDKTTKLPDGLEQPQSWTQGENKQAEKNEQE